VANWVFGNHAKKAKEKYNIKNNFCT